ncbi:MULTISPECIES: sulfite exporter TauE/SafE family protein [unclassified Bradyrhizobium]|uniref:sulfite exporter TauE/SafE family protein n=1 Tax=unclassified Bradyrhizobium TaxID=2631580 RepID=UPI0028E5234D|nr:MULTISPECIES: sulfite exporter TauE/SafE family protein [unclassified Bradyrhizobium]
MRNKPVAFGAGAAIGALGGLIGLGGAEFRLPLLISLFRFRGLEAVILNKATSLIVVAAALAFRARTVPFAEIGEHWSIIANLLAGSLVGAYVGASWATRLKSETLYKIIATLLVVIAGVLLFVHDASAGATAPFAGWRLVAAGVVAGFIIGVIASLLGVAGGEFLIPTLILLFGLDVKLAGSLSLAVSLPTMLVGFARYSRDQSFVVVRDNASFMLAMAAGSIVGAFVGGLLLGVVPSAILLPTLAAILLISAVKVWRHE